jgi:glutamate formiminotransferase / 5-formyltetrahydrofolate cyclo-ligase
MASPTLLAVPNVSEGRDRAAIDAIGAAFAHGVSQQVRLLDVHSDGDHHRSVFTIAAPQGELADAVLRGARAAVERIDVVTRAISPNLAEAGQSGQHPHVGAVDVAPVVYLSPSTRGAACAEALVVADRIGSELEVPVFLYGELTGEDPQTARTRAQLRRGGITGLLERIAGRGERGERIAGRGERIAGRGDRIARADEPVAPDFGPPNLHPSAGATLVAARPPLVAFNLQLAHPAGIEDARRIAALIRENGSSGLPGVRAIPVSLTGGVAQVSMNVERPFDVSLAMVVQAVRAHSPVASAELVGLAPAAAFDGFPEDLPIPGFDPARHLIENALGS